LPDLALFAGDGLWSHYYIICFSDTAHSGAACTGAPSGWARTGGTSAATPVMAGIQALVNQRTGGRQGNPNPVYYALAAQQYGVAGNASCNASLGNTVASSCIFHDITQGDTDIPCTAGSANCYSPSGQYGVLSTSNTSYAKAYGATTGWDFATGLGSVNAYNLVNSWPASCTQATVYRYRNTQILGHFYTTSTADGAARIAAGEPLVLEGAAFNACNGGSTINGVFPVERFKHLVVPGVYFYSMLPDEIASVRANFGNILQDQGIAFYALNYQPSGAFPVYRFRNTTVGGANFYTIVEAEKVSIITNVPGYALEGISYWAMPPSAP
jgi:hypothetical protein